MPQVLSIEGWSRWGPHSQTAPLTVPAVGDGLNNAGVCYAGKFTAGSG